MDIMVTQVVEFSSGGYKIKKVFAQELTVRAPLLPALDYKPRIFRLRKVSM